MWNRGRSGPRQEERRLVERMRGGEARAFEQFCDGYLPGLYRFARRRLGGDRELSRDIVQSTLCKAIEKLGTFRAEAPLFTWLCACCRNEIAGHFRRLDRRPREVELDAPDAAGGPAGTGAGPEERLRQLETAERVHAALDRLPESYARAVEWRYVEGLAVPEIAERLGSSYKATESLLSRARTAFRRVYESLEEDPGAGEPAGEPREERAGR